MAGCIRHSAFDNKDMADAGFALTAIAQRYPGDLRQRINRDAVYLLVDAAKNNDGPGDRWFRLLDALFDAHWAYTEGIEPSWLWCDLARLELERNMPDRVSEIAARITSPEALISLRVDKQFAPLVKARPERFDIEHAAAAEVEVLRGFVAKAPRSLGALVDLSASMLVSRQFAEALRITDEAIARVAAAQGAPAPYDDVDAMFIWVMDERARALQHLNRWPEALEQLRLAAALPESGMTNISLAINAADSCIALERADEALALVEHLREPTPFGRMQVESIRFSAALQKGDEAESDRALAYMSEHRVDAIEAYQDALLEADRIDSAAAVLIARLNDSKERSAALVNVQIYPESPAPSRIIEQRRRFHELLMRADVRATIGRFGIVESFSVSP